MHFGKFRDYAVKIRNYKIFGRLPENVGCIPLAVVLMTTANGMQTTFFGKHPKFFLIISDLFRSLPTSHENYRGPLDPCYVNYYWFNPCTCQKNDRQNVRDIYLRISKKQQKSVSQSFPILVLSCWQGNTSHSREQ